MSLEDAMNSFTRGRRRKYGPYDVTKPPTDEELAGQTPEQREDLWDEAECGDGAYDVLRIEDDAGRVADAATGRWAAPTSTRTD